jgi:ATP-dependent Lhr-like helicase
MAGLARRPLESATGKKSLFFCQTRALTEAIAERMRGRSSTCSCTTARSRSRSDALAEERFHHGTNACIVCTSTLELGIDVGDLDLVLPGERAPSTCLVVLQRMGRTGRRAGQTRTRPSSARKRSRCSRPWR